MLPKLKTKTWVGAVFLNAKGFMEEYYSLFQEMAERYNCSVIAGSGIVVDGRGVFNESRGYGPRESDFVQRKVHLIDLEDEDGLALTKASAEDIGLWQTFRKCSDHHLLRWLF